MIHLIMLSDIMQTHAALMPSPKTLIQISEPPTLKVHCDIVFAIKGSLVLPIPLKILSSIIETAKRGSLTATILSNTDAVEITVLSSVKIDIITSDNMNINTAIISITPNANKQNVLVRRFSLFISPSPFILPAIAAATLIIPTHGI